MARWRISFRLIVVIGFVLPAIIPVGKRTAVGSTANNWAEPGQKMLSPNMEQSQRDYDSQKPAASAPMQETLLPAHTIFLKSREFQPDAPVLEDLQHLAARNSARIHLLVQLDFIPRKTGKAAYKALGLDLLAYVPDFAWIASYPVIDLPGILSMPGLIWAGELTVDDKLDPAIAADLWSPFNRLPGEEVAVNVVMHKDESIQSGRVLVKAHGGRITGQAYGINLLMVELPLGNLRSLAGEDAVQWIEPAGPPLKAVNDGLRAQIGVNAVNAVPYDLDGSGIDVLVYDSGQVGDHVDFGTRLTHGDVDVVSEHSTHVAGTVGGDGSNSVAQGGTALQWRGMAPGVDLISFGTGWTSGIIFYEDVGDIEADWAGAQNTYGADLGTASLSSNIYYNYPSRCDLMGNYGAASVLIDQIVRGGNSVVGVGDRYITTWAAGNERNHGSSCSNTYNSTSPPASAKNPIHIGASTTDTNAMTTFSSWGPTDDGRIKPIVVAGGDQVGGDGGIKSTDNSPVNTYTVMQGTSMATPAVAGGIALMLEHYRDVYNTSGNFWPSTAKAILMQTATDYGNSGPDYQWGYGQVDIEAAVDLIARKAFRQESLSQGEVDLFYFMVPDSATPVSVSLAWDDFEATFNANPTLINNLNLELVDPSGTTWYPWVLNPASPASNATRGVNTRDNQEQVQVPSPAVGTWLVRVRGTTVPQGPQGYTLVCEGCKPLAAGACQSHVATALEVPSLEMQDIGPQLNAEGEELVWPSQSVEISAGEQWQRWLEAGMPERELPLPSGEDAPIPSGESLSAVPAFADPLAPARQWQLREQGMMATYEMARAQGPEGLLAVLDTLSGRALDLATEEMQEYRQRMALQSVAPADTGMIDPAEEAASLAEQAIIEATNRAQAFDWVDDPREGNPDGLEAAIVPSNPEIPAVDLTVGNGCSYATIAAAISAANPGDRLLIEGGVTFNENIVINKNLTLEGGYNGCVSGSTANTLLNGSAANSVVRMNAGLDVTLRNLDLTNGISSLEGGGIRFAIGGGGGTLTLSYVKVYGNTGQWGGGVWVGPDVDLVADHVEIYNNTATAYGGGVRLFGASATFSDSNIHDNSAPLGGGAYATLESGFAPNLALPTYADLYDNQAMTGSGFGGGVYMRQGSLSLSECSDLYSNDAIAGGGAYLITTTLVIHGSCSEIQANTATGSGGGVYAIGGSVNLDEQAQLYSNDAGASGGGAYLDNSALYSDRAEIVYNQAGNHGGGVYAANGSTVDMDLGAYPCQGTRCSLVYGNSANSNYGGGIYANNSTVYLDNTFVESNSAQLGGGIYAYTSDVYAYSSLFARNNATSTAGDGLRLYSSAQLNGSGNTFAYNDANGASTGRAIDLFTSNTSLSCSVIWGHSTSINITGEEVTYSDIQGGYTGQGNLDINPLFVNPTNQDYHLQSGSPVIDRCLSAPSLDYENQPRPVVIHSGATSYDMGADEYGGGARAGVNGACAYSSIQQAIDAASDGDTVRLASGVYFESANLVNKSLIIQGSYDATCTTPGGGTTRIEGSPFTGSTLDISGGSVTLRDLQVAWGQSIGGGVDVRSNARVTLNNADVVDNFGTYGGGIYIDPTSVVTLTNDSDIDHNIALDAGGGVRIWGQLFGNDTYSDISDNCAPHGGGLSIPGGTLHLDNNDVFNNLAAGATGQGGGIHAYAGATVTLENNAWVGTTSCCQEAYDGGGIYAAGSSTVNLLGNLTTVMNNTASHHGGGLYLDGSTLHSTDSRIGYTSPAGSGNDALVGGGIYATNNSTVDFSGTIYNNIASSVGAGLYASGGTVNLTNAQIGGLGNNQANQLGPSGYFGAGIYLENATIATLDNSTVVGNLFQATLQTFGGGIYAAGGISLTLRESRVENHLAQSTSFGRGAGLYMSDSTVTLDHSQIVSNTAGTNGGAVRMYGTSTLNLRNGSTLANNIAQNGEGGAVAATMAPTLNLLDSTFADNSSATDGGALSLAGGTLIAERCTFSGNQADSDGNASGNGGAIYFNNSNLQFARNMFFGNAALRGGALFQTGPASVAQVDNNLIFENSVSTAFGAGIRAEAGSITLNHATLANNQGGAGLSTTGVSSFVYNSIVWGNAMAGSSTVTDYRCNIYQGGAAGLNIDPAYVAPGAGQDYHLRAFSPAIDACDSGLVIDLDGNVRPAGVKYDMGAYEFVPQAPYFGSTPVINATEDLPYAYDITASDPNPYDVFTITATTLPGWLSFSTPGGGVATLSGTPGNAEVGIHPVELQVVDAAGLLATQNFDINVFNVNDAPTISDISDQHGYISLPTAPIPFTVDDIDIDDPPASLTVSAATSDPALVPLSGFIFGGSVGSRTVIILPSPGKSGTVTITISVSDGVASASDSFLLTISGSHLFLPMVVR